MFYCSWFILICSLLLHVCVSLCLCSYHFFILSYVIVVIWSAKRKCGTASVNTDSQWDKQEACLVVAPVFHSTSVTSGEWIRCLKRIARASELGNFQSNFV